MTRDSVLKHQRWGRSIAVDLLAWYELWVHDDGHVHENGRVHASDRDGGGQIRPDWRFLRPHLVLAS